MSARHGEKETTHFRSERILCMNGQWFFAVREKTNLVGPYNSKQSAEKAAAAYTKDILSGRSEIDAMSNQFLMRAFSLK
jgi:wobble nucleotide-excising tRNase